MHAQQGPLNQRRNPIEIKIPFSREQIDIAVFTSMVTRDDCVARAESAQRFTKRKMKIERPARSLIDERFVQMLDPLISRWRVGPKRDGRITGVWRRRDV